MKILFGRKKKLNENAKNLLSYAQDIRRLARDCECQTTTISQWCAQFYQRVVLRECLTFSTCRLHDYCPNYAATIKSFFPHEAYKQFKLINEGKLNIGKRIRKPNRISHISSK